MPTKEISDLSVTTHTAVPVELWKWWWTDGNMSFSLLDLASLPNAKIMTDKDENLLQQHFSAAPRGIVSEEVIWWMALLPHRPRFLVLSSFCKVKKPSKGRKQHKKNVCWLKLRRERGKNGLDGEGFLVTANAHFNNVPLNCKIF